MQQQPPHIDITLDGNRFDDIRGFYDEINRAFMPNENWRLGDSLDALNDMLYGGYGVSAGASTVCIHWENMAKSRRDLGVEATRSWLTAKLDPSGRHNQRLIRGQIAALDRGEGQTFFAIVQAILADHPRIRLKAG